MPPGKCGTINEGQRGFRAKPLPNNLASTRSSNELDFRLWLKPLKEQRQKSLYLLFE